MISSAMRRLVETSSAIRAMFEEGKRMEQEFGKENVFDFSLGNPNTPPPYSVTKEAMRILQETEPVYLHGYMNNAGFEEVRSRLANSLNQRFQTDFTKDHIFMTVGAAGAINLVLKVILEKGDEVLLQAPFFAEYRNYLSNFDAVPVVLSPKPPEFSLNLEELEKKISSKTKAFLLNSPNNPTGVIYPEEDLKKLCSFLHQKEKEYGHAIYLVSDEPYREIVFDDRKVPFLTHYYANTFVCYSYSKSLSLPGERIGYAALCPRMEEVHTVFQALAVASRVLGFVNAPGLQQQLVGALPDEVADIGIYERNRERLYTELTRMGFSVKKPEGTFYMFPKSPTEDESIFIEAAKEEHILVVPGSGFDCPGYFRIAFCVPEERVKGALPGFERLSKRFGLS